MVFVNTVPKITGRVTKPGCLRLWSTNINEKIISNSNIKSFSKNIFCGVKI